MKRVYGTKFIKHYLLNVQYDYIATADPGCPWFAVRRSRMSMRGGGVFLNTTYTNLEDVCKHPSGNKSFLYDVSYNLLYVRTRVQY